MPSGPKPISGFDPGTPLAGDFFVFESVGGVTLKIAFADLQAAIGAGPPGADGARGPVGPMMPPEDPEEPEAPVIIPGPQGLQGPAGIAGATIERTIFLPVNEPEDPEDPLIIKGDRGATGAAGGGGTDPFEGSYAPGTFDIADGDYVVMGGKLILNGTETITINGDGRLVIV